MTKNVDNEDHEVRICPVIVGLPARTKQTYVTLQP
jgi:hypothetical protein